MIVEGFLVGLHHSPYHGFSVEFSQHRPYIQGDPLKDVDWKVYGKSDKYYIKQFEEETNLLCNIFLDSSKSMMYKNASQVTKMEYAATLAAALSYLLINQKDAAGLTIYSDKIEAYYPPKSTKAYMKSLLLALNNINPAGRTDTGKCLEQIAEKLRKRGMAIFISDFLDDAEKIIKTFKHAHFKKNEVIVFQILDPSEIDFNFSDDSSFVDLETGDEISAQPHLIKKSYRSRMKEHLDFIKQECYKLGIEYNLIDTSQSFDKALSGYFMKRSKMF